ncbi:MAG TPA: phosphopantetheine-binding protein, partial [Mycobacteriales bacterium]|nr:phosphopantetheine-binding protein [Mycobacteriales bacterium]
LGIEPELLTEQASLSEDLGLDSLAGIELATALEDRFSLRITDDELSALRTYGDLERLVLRKVAA